MGKTSYIVTRTGWVAGLPRKKGERVQLTPIAAQYEHVKPAPKPRRRPRAGDGKGAK